MRAKQLNAKLFLEGMEVPFIGATITNTVGMASIAYIDLIPHASINNIKPRTLVQIAVLDTLPDGSSRYVLAWEGEVFGISFGKTPTSRSFSISCIDVSSYWDNALVYFFDAQMSMSKGAPILSEYGLELLDNRATGTQTVSVVHSATSYFIQVIKRVFAKEGTDFLDGFIGVINDITKLNDFYHYADDRLLLNDRIVMKSSGALSELLDEHEALEWFNGMIGESGLKTLRQAIQELMGVLFHDFTPIPFPALVEREAGTRLRNPIVDGNVPKTIGELVFKPNLFMMPPPVCNIFYPDEYSSFNFNRNFFQEPTRLIYRPQLPVFNNGAISLPHSYEPPSFRQFMLGKGAYDKSVVGGADTQVPADQGHYGGPVTDSKYSGTYKTKREFHFLTNEEYMKGPLLAIENMVPANSSFRASLGTSGKRTFSQAVAKYLFYKKRFQGRECQITSHLKMSVVPGFPVLILDDSDANQSVIAYCNSVTHRIYATQGGYTNVTLSYARQFEEQDATANQANEPLIPPWFEAEIFGKVGAPPKSSDADINKGVQARGDQIIVPAALSNFYATLLGTAGSQTINQLTKEATMYGAVMKLRDMYRENKSLGTQPLAVFIDTTSRRRYVKIQDAFKFLGATTSATQMTEPNIKFSGTRLDGYAPNSPDNAAIQKRREIILNYRQALNDSRGFRG